VGDFHGDAAMGFWGWPIEQSDAPRRACRAALEIRNAFRSGTAADFRVGIGIASGRAVAGKIGTADQVKVTAFGPVVNRASRLETLTRRIHAEILLDPNTAAALRATLPTDVGHVRRIAMVQPAGLAEAIDVSELVPCGALSIEQLAFYEAALLAFQTGNWHEASELLQPVPPCDAGREFLSRFMARHDSAPPPNWDGAIRLQEK
jgi:adenylate cyclase